jgi:hypothetical protein
MRDVIPSSEISVLTRTTWNHIAEDGIIRGHRRENLKSYKVFEIFKPLLMTLLRSNLHLNIA